jgi:hypothetical protein
MVYVNLGFIEVMGLAFKKYLWNNASPKRAPISHEEQKGLHLQK